MFEISHVLCLEEEALYIYIYLIVVCSIQIFHFMNIHNLAKKKNLFFCRQENILLKAFLWDYSHGLKY